MLLKKEKPQTIFEKQKNSPAPRSIINRKIDIKVIKKFLIPTPNSKQNIEVIKLVTTIAEAALINIYPSLVSNQSKNLSFKYIEIEARKAPSNTL